MSTTTPAPTALQTEFSFELPIGYEDDEGRVHRSGAMRLARARDEIVPLRDPRVRDNEAYLTVLLLARTITHLGDIPSITPAVVENLFTPDLAFLQDLYRRIHSEGHTTASVTCSSLADPIDLDRTVKFTSSVDGTPAIVATVVYHDGIAGSGQPAVFVADWTYCGHDGAGACPP